MSDSLSESELLDPESLLPLSSISSLLSSSSLSFSLPDDLLEESDSELDDLVFSSCSFLLLLSSLGPNYILNNNKVIKFSNLYLCWQIVPTLWLTSFEIHTFI